MKNGLERGIDRGSLTCDLDTQGHCITCSDEALPARVLHVDELMGMASVSIEDILDEVDITLLDDVAEGDLVLVHGGVAIAKSRQNAEEVK